MDNSPDALGVPLANRMYVEDGILGNALYACEKVRNAGYLGAVRTLDDANHVIPFFAQPRGRLCEQLRQRGGVEVLHDLDDGDCGA